MQEAVLQIVKMIVDDPDAVRIDQNVDEYGQTLLTVHVAQEDMGKVIGKGGKIIRAVRNLSKVLAVKSQTLVMIQLAELPPTSS